MTTPSHFLKPFFEPKSVAVIGASRKPGSLGYMFLKTLLDFHFQGTIYPVHPSGDPILGIPTYPSLNELPTTPDLAVIMVRRDLVAEVLTACGEQGVLSVIIITAGFREVGEEGRRLEEQLVSIARQYGIRFLGPNCMGLFNTDPAVQLNASFSPIQPLTGSISFISQSGALAVAVLETARRAYMGFAKMVSVGNKADLTDLDFLDYLRTDPQTQVIMMYQEGVESPRQFFQLARQITPTKPIVVLKGGKSESASRAASSHTGALATPTALVEGLYQQAGIISATGYDDFIFTAMALSRWKHLNGKRIGVVTNAGGPGILTVDALEQAGLEIPPFSSDLQNRLAALLPPEAAVGNPVDMIASATEVTYREVVAHLQQSPEVDAILVVIVRPPVQTTVQDIARELGTIAAQSPKPLGVVVLADWQAETSGLPEFQAAGIPVFPSPEVAAQTFRQVSWYFSIRSHLQSSVPTVASTETASTPWRDQLLPLVPPQNGWLPADVAFRFLETAGIPVPAWGVASSLEEARQLLPTMPRPVVMKILSPQVVHKSDSGGVVLNIHTPEQVAQTWHQFTQLSRADFQVLLQEQVSGKRELIIGAHRDPAFGPTLMVGLGGIFVEVLQQVTFRLLPLSRGEAHQLLQDLPGKPLLGAVRGMRAVDEEALVNILLAVSRLMVTFPEITSLDINPLILSDDGQHLMAVDVRMEWQSPSTEGQQ